MGPKSFRGFRETGPWPMNASDAGGDLVSIKTSLLFSFKCELVSIRIS